jgi:hypothetical protein
MDDRLLMKFNLHDVPRFLHRLCQRTILTIEQVYHIFRRREKFTKGRYLTIVRLTPSERKNNFAWC